MSFPAFRHLLSVADAHYLLLYLVDAAKYRTWTPGSITALITLIGNGICIGYSFAAAPHIILPSLVLTPIIGIIIIINLRVMLSKSQAIEQWRTKHI